MLKFCVHIVPQTPNSKQAAQKVVYGMPSCLLDGLFLEGAIASLSQRKEKLFKKQFRTLYFYPNNIILSCFEKYLNFYVIFFYLFKIFMLFGLFINIILINKLKYYIKNDHINGNIFIDYGAFSLGGRWKPHRSKSTAPPKSRRRCILMYLE